MRNCSFPDLINVPNCSSSNHPCHPDQLSLPHQYQQKLGGRFRRLTQDMHQHSLSASQSFASPAMAAVQSAVQHNSLNNHAKHHSPQLPTQLPSQQPGTPQQHPPPSPCLCLLIFHHLLSSSCSLAWLPAWLLRLGTDHTHTHLLPYAL
jgi:hypothetical protein